ncbi:hypothetical protein [Denitrobaculum tricleocarpae]|uniref:Uncharacterized protein n=1 Tax=Denitrobaculum tricleocarpae TaxID=2591009 RepID=A0A545TKU1_9PROT|nr:hypothetical protein [Denitrobaculum tricleocarpae]TQV77781.1 hypothetical protein FKG95_19670 [Denitrobaculum tricleocarpae]
MPDSKFALALSGFLLLAFVKAGPAAADAYTTCLGEIADADLEAKTAYQRALRDLIVDRRPEFAELADINRDLQLLLAQMRFARVDYLLTTAPERVDGKNGLSRFRNFDWTQEDLDRMTANSTEYREQSVRLERLKGRNQGHPDWPAMRSFVRSEMSEGGAFAQITADFIEAGAALEARMAGCSEN